MGIGIWELLLVFLIVLLLFGTKKLKTIGGDLGGAIRSFRKSMNDGESENASMGVTGADGDSASQANLAGTKG